MSHRSYNIAQVPASREWTITQDSHSRTFTAYSGVGPAGPAGSGSSLFTDLTDKATADLPVINTPLATALGLKAPSTGIAPSAITGTAVITTDPRLSDARTPTAHAHDDLYPPRLSTITITGPVPIFPSLAEILAGENGFRSWSALYNGDTYELFHQGGDWYVIRHTGDRLTGQLYLATCASTSNEPWKLTFNAPTVGVGLITGITIDPPALQPVGNTGTTALSPNQDGSLTATDVGSTTVGAAMFTLTNPGAITFPRINANNTITARSAADMRTDLSTPASDPTGITGADAITNIVSLTAAEYAALGSTNATTLYVVI